MKRNTVAATLAAFCLTAGTLFGTALPAFADEGVPPVEEVVAPPVEEVVAPPVEEVVAPPVEEVAAPPAEEPAAPPVEEVVAPPAEEVVIPVIVTEAAPSTEASRVTTNTPPEKVYVCKFVASANAPGGFVLQSGQNPIHVSVNALGDDVNNTGTFNDQQPSFIVPSNDPSLCSHSVTLVDEQVVCPDGDDGVVNITTTTTLYYGSTPVGEPLVEHSTRPLTAEELEACEPEEDKKVWVCKFVASENAPHGFVLKEGKNPIHVSVNALGDDVNDTGTFNDEQPSFIVDSEDAKCVDEVVDVDEDIVCPTEEDTDGVVYITTTTTTYYGTTVVDVDVEYSTRDLTAEELEECGPDLPTEGLVVPSYSSVQPTCSAAGSYTIGAAINGDHLLWYVDGAAEPTPFGTYQVTSSKTVTLLAVSTDPVHYGLATLDSQPWSPNPVVLEFDAATCGGGQLTTLAYTGSSVPLAGLAIGGSLLVLGGAVLTLRRRADKLAA